MKLTFAEITACARAAVYPSSPVPGSIESWSTDSRSIEPGSLFIALRGPNHDGHNHVASAFERGAAAAVVEHGWATAQTAVFPGPLLAVTDTLDALKLLGSFARKKWGGPLAAVTGSAGKTSTKDIIADLLAARMPVGKSGGNLNNHIGLPLSLLRIPETARAAVVEMGMNHPGELRELSALARPDIGVVTNVGYAHIEMFDSIDGIAAAKRELIESLPPGGTAVLNADDDRVARFAEVHAGPAVTFGMGERAQVRATDLEFTDLGSRFTAEGVRFETRLAGRHGVLNVLAGVAVARIFGIPAAELRLRAAELTPGPMRGERFTRNGITIYNDTYNANPDAVRAMLDVLRDTPARRRIAVLGEMLELGRWSEPLHRDIGRYVARGGITVLVGIRGAARFLVEEARQSGIAADAAYFFDEPPQAGEFLRQITAEGDAILFKGSRGTRVEQALERYLG